MSGGATTVAPELIVKLAVIEALLMNVFVPTPIKVVEANAEEPVIVPAIVCADVLLKKIRPLFALNIPLFK